MKISDIDIGGGAQRMQMEASAQKLNEKLSNLDAFEKISLDLKSLLPPPPEPIIPDELPAPNDFLLPAADPQEAVKEALDGRSAEILENARAQAEENGVDFDAGAFLTRMSDMVSVYSEAIEAVAGGSAETIDDIRDLVGGLEIIDEESTNATVDGSPVFYGLAVMDTEDQQGGIVLNPALNGDPSTLRKATMELLSERMFQEISGNYSLGDFGAEVAGRIDGALSWNDITRLRSAEENDTYTIRGVSGEASSSGRSDVS